MRFICAVKPSYLLGRFFSVNHPVHAIISHDEKVCRDNAIPRDVRAGAGLVDDVEGAERPKGGVSANQVDDKPFGGGAGMLLMIEPLTKAIERARQILPRAKVLLMTPAKTVWDQKRAWLHAESDDDYIIVCGRYEGFDARVEELVDEKISVGRYVLTGGELPAMIVIDSIVRLLPGVLGGGDEATVIESYSQLDALEYPQYTRPEEYKGRRVPEVLLSGNHALIEKWRWEHQIDLSADS